MYYANWLCCKLNIVLREFEAYDNLRAKSLFSKALTMLEVTAPTLTTMETWLGQFLMHDSTELTDGRKFRCVHCGFQRLSVPFSVLELFC